MAQGQIRNLDAVLLEWLSQYRPGPDGVEGVGGSPIVTLPIPMWADYFWVDRPTLNLTAGQSTNEMLFTVPEDERVALLYVLLVRTSGDNNFVDLNVVFPVGYGSGDRQVTLLGLTTPATSIFWPDGERQTADNALHAAEVIMEPGSLLRVRPDGSGIAATVGSSRILLRRCKMFRARAP